MINTYNFSRPVAHKDGYAARHTQVAAVFNYLQRDPAESITNIMIIGPRGIGKTSLLNVVYEYAIAQGHVVIRCDLDEQMVSQDATFFLELIDELAAQVRSEVPHGTATRCGGKIFKARLPTLPKA